MFITASQLLMAREALRIPTRVVAADLKMSYPGLSRIETGKTDPQMSTINKLVTYYQSKGVEFGPDGWVRVKPRSAE